MFTVYILTCADGSYHLGVTKDLVKRLAYHQTGQNPEAYTYARLPVKLAFQQKFDSIQAALAFEKKIKSISTTDIQQLIGGTLKLEYPQSAPVKTESVKIENAVILPSTYLPNLAYFEQILDATVVILDQDEFFQKQTYRSRCSILTANGIQNLSVPVIRPNGKQTRMRDVTISYAENWEKDHIKALESAYRKAPYYSFYAAELFEIIEQKHNRLVDLNAALLRFLLGAYGFTCTTRFSAPDENRSTATNILVNPKAETTKNRQPYQQVLAAPNHFTPNLSAVDLLFNVGGVEGKPFFKS